MLVNGVHLKAWWDVVTGSGVLLVPECKSMFDNAIMRDMEPLSNSFNKTADAGEYAFDSGAEIRE